MNEPHRGYINVPSLHAFDYNTDLHLSHVRELLLFNVLNEKKPGLTNVISQLPRLNLFNWVLAIRRSCQLGHGHSPCPQSIPHIPS